MGLRDELEAGLWIQARRPVVFALAALAVSLVSLAYLPALFVESVRYDPLTSARVVCPQTYRDACLEQIAGRVHAVHYRKHRPEWAVGNADVATMPVGWRTADRLYEVEGQRLNGWVINEELVAIELPNGLVARSSWVGIEGVAQATLVALIAVGLLLGLLAGTFEMLTATGSWFRSVPMMSENLAGSLSMLGWAIAGGAGVLSVIAGWIPEGFLLPLMALAVIAVVIVELVTGSKRLKRGVGRHARRTSKH